MQEKLAEALGQTGKPIIALIFHGRPLVLTEVMPSLDAALLCWQPGIQGGPALYDVLLGRYNPSGKLPMSLPYHLGQVPIYYNHLNTGRPRLSPEDTDWRKRQYADIPNKPLYPFGYGLSYTQFEYGEIMLKDAVMRAGDYLKVQIEVKNSGDRYGEEVLQLCIQDRVAQVSRPVKELRDFRKIGLKAGESKVLNFWVTVEQLKYWNQEMKFGADPGEFMVMIGGDSENLKQHHFFLLP